METAFCTGNMTSHMQGGGELNASVYHHMSSVSIGPNHNWVMSSKVQSFVSAKPLKVGTLGGTQTWHRHRVARDRSVI